MGNITIDGIKTLNVRNSAEGVLFIKNQTPPQQYNIYFNKNTEDIVTNMPESLLHYENYSFTIPTQKPVRSGFVFQYWSEQENESLYNFYAGSNYLLESRSYTLYAHWRIESESWLSVGCNSGVWTFSLNNIEPWVQNLVNQGKVIRIQLIRYYGYDRQKYLKNEFSLSRTALRFSPNFPSYLNHNSRGLANPTPEDKKANYDITAFKSSNFQNMDLSTWANNMIKYTSSSFQTHINKRAGAGYYFNSYGYWYQKIAFCILVNNQFISLSQVITVNYNNENNLNINTDYTITNNSISVFPILEVTSTPEAISIINVYNDGYYETYASVKNNDINEVTIYTTGWTTGDYWLFGFDSFNLSGGATSSLIPVGYIRDTENGSLHIQFYAIAQGKTASELSNILNISI